MLDFGLRSNVKQHEVRMRKKGKPLLPIWLIEGGKRDREGESEREFITPPHKPEWKVFV